MPKKNIHVVRKGESWAVLSEGSKKAIGLFETQQAAVKKARLIVKKNKLELVIHGAGNQILKKDSFGLDPYPPEG